MPPSRPLFPYLFVEKSSTHPHLGHCERRRRGSGELRECGAAMAVGSSNPHVKRLSSLGDGSQKAESHWI